MSSSTLHISHLTPFGMTIKERSWSDTTFSYRFGFNGMEQDNSIRGQGNSLDFGARIYDSRLGRWMTTDPVFKANLTPYQFAKDCPLAFVDPDGQDEIHFVTKTIKTTMEDGSIQLDAVNFVYITQSKGKDKFYRVHDINEVSYEFSSNNPYTFNEHNNRILPSK